MALITDFFATDTTANWTVRAGSIWVHDAANQEADLVVSNPRYCVQYNTSPGGADHECQGTFQVGTSSSHGGACVVAVRVNNGATKQWYYVAVYPRDSIIQLLRRNDGSDSSGSSSTQLGGDQAFTVADGDWITVCLAAEGTTISLWFTNHGASPPVAEPAWLSEGGAAQHSATDATYNHQYVGMAGNSSGSDYDTRTKWWKARLISDRPGGARTTRNIHTLGLGMNLGKHLGRVA